MDLVTPSIGLIFWTSLTFIFLLIVLSKFAWRPILSALNNRERYIEDSLKAADKACNELSKIEEKSKQLLKEARIEREKLIKDAKNIQNNIIAEAKKSAKEEEKRIIEQAQEEINTLKRDALSEAKNMVALLSLEIAEKILKRNLHKNKEQEEFINNLLKDIKFS